MQRANRLRGWPGLWPGLWLGAWMALGGCSDASGEAFGAEGLPDGGGAGGSGACFTNQDCPSGAVCYVGQCIYQGGEQPRGDAAVPEEEQSFAAFTVPAAGREHVWVAAPAIDTLVRIHAESLELSAIEVGDEPTEVRAVADSDRVVVLNRGSDELAVVAGPDDLAFMLLPGHFNTLALTPDGGHALCWFDLDQARRGEDTASLQDLAVVALDTGRVFPVTVGYRPRRVIFTADGAAAVVTDDGISVFDPAALDGPLLAPTVPVAPSVFGQSGREVVLSPDGAFAASRGPGEPGVTVVDMTEGTPHFIDLGAEPTDLDLLPDGRTALVMLRDAQRLALVPLATAPSDPESIRFIDFTGHVLGSAVVAEGFALLYTTLADARAQVSLLDLTGEVLVHRPLRKGVAGIEVAPSGRQAIIVHTKAEGTADPAEGEAAFLAKSHAYSLLDVVSTLTRLQITPAAPEGIVFSAERDEAFLVLRNSAVAAMQRIDLEGFSVETYDLGNPPEVVGVLPAVERAFVTQTHPEGRISFLHLTEAVGEGGRLETVSGYTLNGRID